MLIYLFCRKLHQELTFNDPKGFLCVYVGRISKEKRIDTIFEAISALDNVYLALIGDGPTAQHWAGLHSKENKLYCKPKFLSHDELAEIYASSDLHVSASEFETLGNTVLEAQASNIAVVVPETQGFCNTVTTRDIEVQDEFSGYIGNEVNKASDIVMVQKKHDGYLFRPGDALDARRYIKQLKENADLRKRLGDNGRANVGRFTHSNIVKDMLNWYRRGIRNNQSRSYLKAMCIYFVLIGTIPFTIVALFCYDMVVSTIPLKCICSSFLFMYVIFQCRP